MSSKRYPEEFKIEAVKQVVDRGHSVASVANRLDVTTHSLYAWIKKYGPDSAEHQAKSEEQTEINRLKKELKQVTEARDILKKAAVLRKPVRLRYTFVKENAQFWPIRRMCRILDIHPSGYYAWCKQPYSKRSQTEKKLTGLIKQFWLESGGVYGYRNILSDLRDTGEQCGINRVHRLMSLAGLRAQVRYRKPRQKW